MYVICPHCQFPLTFDGPAAPSDVRCPSCGSDIHLESGRSTILFKPEGGRFLGRFELLEPVGTGAFGTVFKALDTQLQRLVAVKVPRAGIVGDALERFLREARGTAQLRHPAIVPVYDVGVADGIPFLVSEFVEGQTLAERLQSRPFGARAAAALIATLADALDYAHTQGVIHRDIKPANVMLAANDTPHLMDFGLAKRAAEVTLTVEGQLLGTPAYMSPEQARGSVGEVDARSDVYSLGVVLYQLLARELPFRGNLRRLLHQVQRDEPRPLRSLNDRIPRDLETICLKAMAKEPARRYPKAGDLADDLRRFLDGRPIVARPVGRTEKLWRWCKRNPAVAGLSASVAASLLLTAVVATFSASVQYQAAADLRVEKGKVLAALHEAQHQSADLALQQGQRLCESDDTGAGMLWLAEALRLAPADDEDLRRVIGLNLDSWAGELRPLRASFSHELPVYNLALSPDGKTVLTVSDDHTARLWELATGKPVCAPLSHPNEVVYGAFRPDGRQCLTFCRDGKIRQWDTATGAAVGEPISSPAALHLNHPAAYTPDGQGILSYTAWNTVQPWDARTGQRAGKPLIGDVDMCYSVLFNSDASAVAIVGLAKVVWYTRPKAGSGAANDYSERHFAPNVHNGILNAAFVDGGKKIVTTGEDGTARLWDVRTAAPVGEVMRHPERVVRIAVSPDGKLLATASGEAIHLWDAATGQPRSPAFPAGGFIMDLAFSADGKLLACGHTNSTVQLWDAASGRREGQRLPVGGNVKHLIFTPDRRSLVVCSFNRTVRVWDLDPIRKPRPAFTRRDRVMTLAFDRAGRQLLAGGWDNGLRVYDPQSGQSITPELPHSAAVYSAVFTPDGRRILAGGANAELVLWDVATGKPIPTSLAHKHLVWEVAISPDGKLGASASEDGTARLWDLTTGQPFGAVLHFNEHAYRVAFNPDGQTAVAAGESLVRRWELATGQEIEPPLRPTGTVMCLAYSPDGRTLLVGCDDGKALRWDLATARPVGEPWRQPDPVTAVAFSADGKRALTAGGRTAQVWDVATGSAVGPPVTHESTIWGARFSPDGQIVLTDSDDGTAGLWDVPTGKRVGKPLKHPGGVNVSAWSLDGLTLATGGQDGLVRVWDAPRLTERDAGQWQLWVEAQTGMELRDGAVRWLDEADWRVRKERLARIDPGVGR